MKFVKLTLPNEDTVYVNISLARDIMEDVSKSLTSICFNNDYVLKVKEKPQDILLMFSL